MIPEMAHVFSGGEYEQLGAQPAALADRNVAFEQDALCVWMIAPATGERFGEDDFQPSGDGGFWLLRD